MKNLRIFAFFFVIFQFFCGIFVFSQDFLPENDFKNLQNDFFLSQELENLLQKQNFKVERENLVFENEKFAYNIKIFFKKSEELKNSNGVENSEELNFDSAAENSEENLIENLKSPKNQIAKKISEQKTQLAIIFSQKNILSHFEPIADFLQTLKDLPKNCDVIVAFCAQDFDAIKTFPKPAQLWGTEIFASKIENPENTVAILLDFFSDDDFHKKTEIFINGEKKSTPFWLSKKIIQAFFKTKNSFHINSAFSPIFRAGILQGSPRLESFFQKSIAAISITLSNSSALSAVQNFVAEYSPEKTENWEKNYIFFDSHGFFYFSERFFVAFAFFAFFFALMNAFFFYEKKIHGKKFRFLKFFFAFALSFALSFFAFQIFSVFRADFSRATIFLLWIFRLIFSALIFFSVFVILNRIFHFDFNFLSQKNDFFVNFAIFFLIFNALLFSALEISFLAIFLFDCLIVKFFLRFKKIFFRILATIFSIFPFLIFSVKIIFSAQIPKIVAIFNSFQVNLLSIFTLFPFFALFFDVLNQNNFFSKKNLIKKIIFSAILTFALIFSPKFIFHFLKSEKQEFFWDLNKNRIQPKILNQKFKNLFSKKINLKFSENPIRVEILAFASDDENGKIENFSLIESNFDFLKPEKNCACFLVPDFPPKNFSLNFVSQFQSFVKIRAFFKTENDFIFEYEIFEEKL